MPDTKISALGSYSTVHSDDLLIVVDVHDTTMAASGTDKKSTLATFLAGLTGDITYSALAGTIAAHAITNGKMATATANTLAGYDNSGNFNDVAIGSGLTLATGTLSATGSGGTVTSVATGTGLTGGPISTTGTVSIAAGGVGTTQLAASGVTYAKIQNEGASSLLGNPTGSPAAPSEITLGSGLAFSGTTLTATGSGGTVTSIVTGTGLTGGPISTTGTISMATSTANTLAGYNNSGAFSDVAIGTGLSLVSGTLSAPSTPTAQGNFLISGGGVALVSGYTFLASAATYSIAGTIYSSAQTSITLNAADSTFNRYDLIVVNNSGTVTKVTGVAAATPIIPIADPATQLALSIIYVPANSTSSPNITKILLFDEDVGPTAEWTATTTAGTFVLNSTNNPYHGTKDIEGTSVAAATYVQLAVTVPIDPTTSTELVLYIQSKAVWGSKSLSIGWYSSGTLQGQTVDILSSGTFNFDSSITSAYQQIIIPISQFALTAGTSINQLRMTVLGGGANIGMYLDYIQLQTNTNATPQGYPDQIGPNTLLGNPSSTVSAVPSAVTIGANLSITGTTLSVVIPNPSPTTLGGVQSAAAVSHQWINSISTSGVPQLSQPAFTDISGTITTAQIGASQVTYSKLQNEGAASLLGNPTGSPAAPSEITLGTGLAFSGTTLIVSGVGSGTVTSITAGTGLTGGTITTSGTIALSVPVSVANGGTGDTTLTAHAVLLGEGTSAVAFATIGTSGRLLIDQGAAADPAFTAMSGDATITGGGVITIAANAITTTKINNSAVTYAKLQNEGASSLLGNPTGSPAAPSEITLGSGLAFSGTTLTATGSGGTVTSVATGTGLTGGPITGSGTISVATSTANSLAGYDNSGVFSDVTVGTGLLLSGGTLTSNQTVTLTGDVTGTGTTSIATTIKTSVALAGNPTTTTQVSTDNSTRIATTAYVTTAVANAVASVNPAVAVEAATAAILPNTPTYSNGTSGIGATLTSSTNSVLVIDGYTPLLNDRILVKNQATTANNGVYTVTQLGVGGTTPWIMTRAVDFDQSSDMNNTGMIPVVNGTANTTTSWVLTSTVTTVGTDAVTFTEFTINPTTILTTAAAVTVPQGGTGLATLTAHAVLLGEGTSAIAFATIGTSGRLLIDQGAAADPSFTAMSGDATITNAGVITISANAITTTKINNSAVTYAKMQNEGATSLLGNPTGSPAAPSEVTLASSLAFSGTTLGISAPVSVANGGTGDTTLTAHAVLLGEGTSAVAFATIGTSGRPLIDQGSGADPAFLATGVKIDSHFGVITADVDGATITFNLATSDWHTVTLGGNRTLALSNPTVGQQFTIVLIQDSGAPRTVTWFTTIKWAGGAAPVLTTTNGGIDVFTFKCVSSGNYYGFVAGQALA